MIRPLRSRHRRTIVALSGLVPLLFVAGLLARRPIPRMDTVPGAVPGSSAGIVISQSDDLWSGLPIRMTWIRGADGSSNGVRLDLLEELKRPDLLVYWSAVPGNARLPSDAILLGTIADGGSASWPLPSAADRGGTLLLYSLADAEIVGSASAEPVR